MKASTWIISIAFAVVCTIILCAMLSAFDGAQRTYHRDLQEERYE